MNVKLIVQIIYKVKTNKYSNRTKVTKRVRFEKGSGDELESEEKMKNKFHSGRSRCRVLFILCVKFQYVDVKFQSRRSDARVFFILCVKFQYFDVKFQSRRSDARVFFILCVKFQYVDVKL
jgi:hypothetical protein